MTAKRRVPREKKGKSYLLTLDYGARSSELPFIQHLWRAFDRDSLVGTVLVVNNNPYNFEFYLYLNFHKRSAEFERWLTKNYPAKARRYNLFIGDILSAMATRGYNILGLGFDGVVELVLTPEADGTLFLYPERGLMNATFKNASLVAQFKVFLSHSSKDKPVVDTVFDALQKAEVRAWYDKYEIKAGDSISDKINEGLAQSDLGILFLSKNFLDKESGWPRAEMNYFFHKRMRAEGSRFVCVNVDLPHDRLPPVLQDFRYVSWKKKGAVEDIVEAVRSEAQKQK